MGAVTEPTFVIGTPCDGQAPLTRHPDGLQLRASSWDEVWAACPELGVKWRAVTFESDRARDEIIKAWGPHPDMPA
jgi:hypothetical protein